MASTNPFEEKKSTQAIVSTVEADLPKTLPAAHNPVTHILRVDTNSTDLDLEKGSMYLSAPPSATARSASDHPLHSPGPYSIASRKECTMWPSRHALKCKAQLEKNGRRGSNLYGLSQRWGNLSKRQRLLVKILLGLLLVGVAVGIAVGISKAVHGGVYTGQNSSKTLSDGH